MKNQPLRKRIVVALKQAETGTRVNEVCRKMGVSESTLYFGLFEVKGEYVILNEAVRSNKHTLHHVA